MHSSHGDDRQRPDRTEHEHGSAPSGTDPVAERVFELLAPLVPSAGVELLDVEWTGGTLRVVLDQEGGVTTEALTEANRLISPLLDQHDPVPGRYTLEVSSPGVERPLRRLEHYRRAIGEAVIVKTVPGVEPRRMGGTLTAVDEGGLTVEVVEVDGVDRAEPETATIALDDVASARTVFDWDAPKQRDGERATPRKPQRQSQRKAKKSAAAGKQGGKKKKPKTESTTEYGQEKRGRP